MHIGVCSFWRVAVEIWDLGFEEGLAFEFGDLFFFGTNSEVHIGACMCI